MTGAQLDRIEVTGIRGWGHHGVLAAEKELGQEFSADVTLWLSTGPAGRADRLSRTVNYADVVADVMRRSAPAPPTRSRPSPSRSPPRTRAAAAVPRSARSAWAATNPPRPGGLPAAVGGWPS